VKIYYLTVKPTAEQVEAMLEAHHTFIKVAVDLSLRVLAGGGSMHADCEEVLLDEGSSQEDIWGGNWYPGDGKVEFDSFINIRPRQGNRFMEIQDPLRRMRFEEIVREIFQGRSDAAGPADRVRDLRARYLRDPVPVRLGNLASSLNRLSTSAPQPERDSTAQSMMRECMSFLEWVGPDADAEIQPELVEMQRLLARWSRRWECEPREAGVREELRAFARQQSDRVLQLSGLLDE